MQFGVDDPHEHGSDLEPGDNACFLRHKISASGGIRPDNAFGRHVAHADVFEEGFFEDPAYPAIVGDINHGSVVRRGDHQ